VRDEFLTLGEHLKSNGYSTGAFVGAFALDSRFGLDQGFDTYDDEFEWKRLEELPSVERKAEVVVERSLEWLKKQNNSWFLWVHLWDPHDPYEPPEPFLSQYKESPYSGEVAYTDSVLGELFSYMEDNDLFEKTLVIFTGDHGESLGQHGEKTHGFFAYNTTIWIPLIIASPGFDPEQVEPYVSHIDIFPTVCDILNLQKPSFLQGKSLLPLLSGRRWAESPIYFESLHPYYSKGWAPLKGYIFNKEKYIQTPIMEFFDLAKDFDEENNLSEERGLERYEKRLERIIEGMASSESQRAEEKLDREALDKLKSLGYVSSSLDRRKESFTSDDDVKVLMPFYNQAMEAVFHYEEGRKEKAFEMLRKIITEGEDIAAAYINLADLYRREKKIREAAEVLKVGHDTLPHNYKLFSTLISYLLNARQYALVIRTFEGNNYRQMENDPGIWNSLGLAYSNIGDYEKSVEMYLMSLSLDERSPVYFTNLGEAQFSLAVKTKKQTLIDKSLQNFQRAIEIDPEYALAYVGLGRTFRLAGGFDAAIAAFKKALTLNDKLDEALFTLGLTYFDNGEKNKALEIFNLYKQKYYESLPEDLKKRLDDFIGKCKEK
jgi:tetratricopeptide (TPR) repeat protein